MEIFFRFTGLLLGESTTHWWIPLTRAREVDWALMFSLICGWTDGWANNRDTGDLTSHRAHYDGMLMSAPNRNLTQYWLIANWPLKNHLKWNSNQNTNVFFQENTWEKGQQENSGDLFRLQCVKMIWLTYNIVSFFQASPNPPHCHLVSPLPWIVYEPC